MLLIAQPKSASTSLLYTIKEVLKIRIKEGIPKKHYEIDCENFSEIQKHHSNMIERSSLFIKRIIINKKILYREHLLPTKRHLIILDKLLKINKEKIVILLRKPEDSFDSYLRLKNSVIDKEQLLKDLKDFYSIYIDFVQGKEDKILLIHYKELVLNYKKTIKKVFSYYGYKPPKRLKSLKRKKYTGVGAKRIYEQKGK